MKKVFLTLLVLGIVLFKIEAQSTNDVLNVLIENKTITQEQADSLRADAAIKQQDEEAKKKSFPVSAAKKVQISGYTQFRYQNLDEPNKINGFDIRRARLDIKGNISPYWGYGLQFDLAKAPKLLDAFVECKISEYFNLTAGQFLIPFSMENLTSDKKLDIIDRSQVVDALVSRGKDVIGDHNGRDIGIQAGGTILKFNDRSVLDYRLGLFNGAGINITDNNEAKDVIGRIIIHPIAGLDLGVSYLNGLGVYARTATAPVTNHRRNRYGADLSYEIKSFSFRSEFIRGEDSYGVRQGWYAQAGYYVIAQKLQLLLKYDTYNPSISTPNDISTLYTIGANFYFNSYSRIHIGYIFRKEEAAKHINNNIAQVQYQIGF